MLAPSLALAGLLLVTASCDCVGDLVPGTGSADGGPKAGLDAGSATAQLAEAEPNDKPAQATVWPRQTVSPGSPLLAPISGELAGAEDVDWYRLPAMPDADQGARSLLLEPLGSDIDVAFVWPDDSSQHTSFAGPGEPETIPNLSGHEVLVGVALATKKAGRYRLRLTERKNAATTDLEPNREGANTPVVSVPGDVSGLINHSRDEDVFVLDTTALEGPVKLIVSAPRKEGMELTIKNGEDTILVESIGDEIGKKKSPPGDRSDSAAEESRSVTLEMPNLLLPPDAKLQMMVRARYDGSTTPWSVRLVKLASGGDTVVQGEPDSETAPTVLSRLGRQRVDGFFHVADDTDYFQIKIPTEVERQEADDDEVAVPVVVRALVDELDRSFEVTTPNKWARDTEVRRRFTATNEGAAIVMCNRVLPRSEPIVLSMRPLPDDGEPNDWPTRYLLDLTVREAEGEEVEPNGGPGTATAIELGDRLDGWIFPSTDKDHVKLRVRPEPKNPKDDSVDKKDKEDEDPGFAKLAPRLLDRKPDAGNGEEVSIPVTIEVDDPGWDLIVELTDPDGAALARSDNGGVGETEAIELDLPPGDYVVKITGKRDEPMCELPWVLRTFRR